jgi:hypothetical protein
MPMRSAIHYPDTQVQSHQAMASAMLLWDNLHVIVPWEGFRIDYPNNDMAAAWELIGKGLVPDDTNKMRAHRSIEQMLEGGVRREIQYRDDLKLNEPFEIWPQKLGQDTWQMLEESQLTSGPLANGDYPFDLVAGITIMSKLADACAGNTFARVTDKMLAYGLIGDRDEPVLAHSHVVPLTLELIDATAIPLEKLVEFRTREAKEQRGGDYKAWRHAYANAVQRHISELRDLESKNHRVELSREFQDDMARHLKELKRAVGWGKAEIALSPVVLGTVVGAAGFLTTENIAAGLIGAAGPAITKIADMFRAGVGFNEKQRKAMEKNPMAYMYQLSQA